MYTVYWFKTSDHTDVYSEGYVGITKNLKERIKSHKKNKASTPFTFAIKKYGISNLILEVLYEDIPKDQALQLESHFRPTVKIGWNCQRGGELGVEPEWYEDEDNKVKHRDATSLATLKWVKECDTTEARSERARLSWEVNRESYKDTSVGSNNPRAILNEEQVRKIKYELIPSGLSNKEIAPQFGVKHYVISFIRSGKNWSHI